MQYYKKLSIGFTLLIAMLMPIKGLSQQEPVYTQYMNNLATFQPAYIGMSNSYSITFLRRTQWHGFDGNPKTIAINAQVPFSEHNMGLGLSYVHDEYGPVRQDAVNFDFAYHFLVSDVMNCSLGLMAGGNFYNANLSDLPVHDPNDPLAIQKINSKFQPNFGAGVLFNNEKFFIGFSVPKLLKNTITSDTGSPLYHNALNLYAMFGCEIGDEIFKLKPNIFYRLNENNPALIDLNINAIFIDAFCIGATYRFNNSFGFLCQFYPFPEDSNFAPIKFGFAYDLTTFHLTQVNAGICELMFSFNIPGKESNRRKYGKRRSVSNTCRW